MDYSEKNKPLFSILVVLTIFAVCAQSFGGIDDVLAADKFMKEQEKREDARYNNRISYDKIDAEKKRRQAQMDVMKVLNDEYTKMITTINAHRVPSKTQIESNAASFRELRKGLPDLDKSTQAKYYILKAWNEYFADDIKAAHEEARKAYTKSPDFDDARATLVSLTLLAGEKTVKIPKRKTAAKNANYNNPYNNFQPYNTSSQGASRLDLDVDDLNTRLTDPKSAEKISAMELNCLNSTTFKYTPGNEALCVIFWRLSDKEAAAVEVSNEPNSPSSAKPSPAVASTSMPASPYSGYENEYAMQQGMNPYAGAAGQMQDNLLRNTKAFKDMFAKAFDTDKVKFLAVNIDKPAAKRIVVEKIMKNAWPWAHVMTHDPKSGDTQFSQVIVEHDKPLLMITSNDGTIKYAGPAAGFLAPIMLSKVTGDKMDSVAVTSTGAQSTKNPSQRKTGVISSWMSKFAKPGAGSNNTVGTNTKVTSNRTSAEPKEMDVIDEVAASRLLENARTYIKLGRRAITPKKGIELCRELLAEYPNTKYSEEARMLLREVPERYRKRYKITNEEMGL